MIVNRYIILLLLVSVVWGSTFVIIKNTLVDINEFLLVALRNLLAAASLFLYVYFKKNNLLKKTEVIKNGFVLGLLLFLIYSTQVVGLKFTTSAHSAFITGTAVIITPIFLFLFFKQKFNIVETISVIIVFAGLFLLTYRYGEKFNSGDIITLFTAIFCTFHIILAGKFVKKCDAFVLVFYQFLFASIIAFATFFVFNDRVNEFSASSISSIVYLGFVGTLFCYLVSVWSQQFVSTISAVFVFSLEPFFASVFGYYFLNEQLSFIEFLGTMLIFSGVIYYQYNCKSTNLS